MITGISPWQITLSTYPLSVYFAFICVGTGGTDGQGWICRLSGARENITACGVAPSQPQPIGSRKQLEPRSRSAVQRGENFKLTANVPARYDTDFVYMRVYYGRYLRLNEE